MRTAAQENPDVLEDPAPRVLFKRITETALTFDLICFVGEVDMGARVSSELTFAIVRRLRETGVIKPAAPAKLEVDGMFNLKDEVARLRASIDAQMADRVAQEDPDFLPAGRSPRP
jgi:small-conductance mechanosensitive channel